MRTRPPDAYALTIDGATEELVELELTRHDLRVLAHALDRAASSRNVAVEVVLPATLVAKLATQVGDVVDGLASEEVAYR